MRTRRQSKGTVRVRSARFQQCGCRKRALSVSGRTGPGKATPHYFLSPVTAILVRYGSHAAVEPLA
ncbi:hypothetical protein GCM10012280_45270 [Wenjunlia tyrosinilytica]|uniref:Uncharacterized protein n=1 Tax=Wenjunlia tyrosinilytica TaxID=1544741 RepID=A0A917ZV17_9ACTN|nr:hypothetical protein GCM10012280_45270 [Wenjunlia tyrosinilytica]